MPAGSERKWPFTLVEFQGHVRRYHTLGYFAYQGLIVPLESDPCPVIRYGEEVERPDAADGAGLRGPDHHLQRDHADHGDRARVITGARCELARR